MVLMLILFGSMSIISSIQNLISVEQHRSRKRMLTDAQLHQVHVYSIMNLIYVVILLPVYILSLYLRRSITTVVIAAVIGTLNSIRIITYYMCTITQPRIDLTFPYLAYFNPLLETFSFWLLTLGWINAMILALYRYHFKIF